MNQTMAKQNPFKLNDRVLSSKWPGHIFVIVVALDDRYAIENDKIGAIDTINELNKSKKIIWNLFTQKEH